MNITVMGAQGTGKSSLVESLRKTLSQDHCLTEAHTPLSPNHPPADFTLLMGLDLPHTPHLGRLAQTGEPTREQMDAQLRAALAEQGCPFGVVYGRGAARTVCALQAIAHHAGLPDLAAPPKESPWQWDCDKCSDGSCEHRMFTSLLKKQVPCEPALDQ